MREVAFQRKRKPIRAKADSGCTATHGDDLARFADAVRAGQTEEAIRARQGIEQEGRATIAQDREIVALLACDEDPRLDAAVHALLERYLAEGHAAVEVQIMLAALGGLRDPRAAFLCSSVLETLIPRRRYFPREGKGIRRLR